MCEPLSVGVHVCCRANVGPETNVLVMGAGPIGLVTMLAARAFGSQRIVIVDVDDQRLSIAKQHLHNIAADLVYIALQQENLETRCSNSSEELAEIFKLIGGVVVVAVASRRNLSVGRRSCNGGKEMWTVTISGYGRRAVAVRLCTAAEQVADGGLACDSGGAGC
ncbi:Sorbitol dehydrogenase [Striga hermonthica]|uniref:Sorbitol dehydrogenase n=1 Tax=Striga hermonthica TaxID=68872 RepID=A0A9N7RHW5_STRHE|nr:Sorbitol dehydrogenase [Striga hermonthica]